MARTVLRWNAGDESGFATIDFDAVETEAPEHEATLTEYPVELGSSLVDNIRIMPVKFRMSVVLSNSPSRADVKSGLDGTAATSGVDVHTRTGIAPTPRGQQVLARKTTQTIAGLSLATDVPVTADAYLLGGQGGANVSTDSVVRADVRVWGDGGTPLKRITSVYAELRNAMATARLFTIVCDLGDFDNMVLKSIRPQRSAANSRAPKFDLEFQQLLTASLVERDVTALLPKRPRSKPAKDAGNQQVAPVANVPARRGSLIRKFTSKVAKDAGL